MGVLDHVRGPLEDSLQALTVEGRRAAQQLLADLDADLAAMHLVPPERQAAYVERIQSQVRASLERQRIAAVRVSRAQLVVIITSILRAALAVL